MIVLVLLYAKGLVPDRERRLLPAVIGQS